jgi:hypothetical protein
LRRKNDSIGGVEHAGEEPERSVRRSGRRRP